MEGRRSGRVQVTALQFMDLTNRVEKLEAMIESSEKELTKKDIIGMLDHRGISYNARSNKDDLLALLEQGD